MALKSAVLAAGPGGPRHTAEMALLTFLLVASRPTRPTNLNGSLEICGFNICIICCSDYMYYIYTCCCLRKTLFSGVQNTTDSQTLNSID